MEKKYIYGINPVIEALRAQNLTISEIIIQKGKDNKRINSIVHAAQKRKVQIRYEEKDKLNLRFDKVHQGVIAAITNFTYIPLKELLAGLVDKKCAKLLFLDCIEDPQNLGALIRSACAFGFDGIIIQDKRSASVTPAAIKVSSGTIFQIPVCLVKNMNKAIETVKKSGFWTVGTVINTDKYIHDIDMDMKIALIIGNEEKGLRNLVARNCDFLVKIPISEKVNSLNASAAGACAMYEIMRQQLQAST